MILSSLEIFEKKYHLQEQLDGKELFESVSFDCSGYKIDNLKRKEFYTLEDYYYSLCLSKQLKALDIDSIIQLLKVFEFYGDYFSFQRIEKNIKDVGNSKELQFSLFKIIAKGYKNIGKYEIAQRYYLKLVEVSNVIGLQDYAINLLAKFHNDYFLREGLYRSFLKISFDRLEDRMIKNRSNISDRRMVVIVDSYYKIYPTKKLEKFYDILNNKKISKRFEFTKNEADIIKEKDINIRKNLIDNYLNLCNREKSIGNFRAYYERILRIFELGREYNFYTELETYINNRDNIDNLFLTCRKYAYKTNNIKLFNRYAKEYAYRLNSKLVPFNIKNSIAWNLFKDIQTINASKIRKILKPKFYLFTLENLRDYFVKHKAFNYAYEIETQHAVLLKDLLAALNEDEENFKNSKVGKFYSVIKSMFSIEEIKFIEGQFKQDYKTLLKLYYKSMNTSQLLSKWNVQQLHENVINKLFKFKFHEFASSINNLIKHGKSVNDPYIINESNRLKVLLNEGYNTKYSLTLESISINELVVKEIYEFLMINDNDLFYIENKIPIHSRIICFPELIKMIIRNIIYNIFEFSNFPNKKHLYIEFKSIKLDNYLVFGDNLGNFEEFKKYIDKININETSPYNVKGNGLRFVKNYINQYSFKKDLILKETKGGKELYIPIDLKPKLLN